MKGRHQDMHSVLGWTAGVFGCLSLWLPGTGQGAVTCEVYLADANTPLALADPDAPGVYRDIMVGTHLTFIISSDSVIMSLDGEGDWSGGELLIGDPYRDNGLLSARDYNDMTLDWQGSRFPAAGMEARVQHRLEFWEGRELQGFELSAFHGVVPGEWFVLDYRATQVGQCVVEFTDYSVSFYEPVSIHVFSQVPTRDFDSDGRVGFGDFAQLASAWKAKVSAAPNDPNSRYDLNANGQVDVSDLRPFFSHWLDTTK